MIDTRSVSAFNTLTVYNKIDVYYTQDTTLPEYKIQVVTGKHLLYNITTEVKNGILEIRNENKCNFVRGSNNDVTVYITAPHIHNFVQEGVGTIYSSGTIVEDTIDYKINNSGDVRLNVSSHHLAGHLFGVGDGYSEGNTNSYYIYADGRDFVHSGNLRSDYCYIFFKSTGVAEIGTANYIDADIEYKGNVYYSGDPGTIHKTEKSSGQLLHK